MSVYFNIKKDNQYDHDDVIKNIVSLMDLYYFYDISSVKKIDFIELKNTNEHIIVNFINLLK